MKLIHGDCLDVMPTLGQFDCLFADPPDNIGLDYGQYHDEIADNVYEDFLHDLVTESVRRAPIVWISFNSRWLLTMASAFDRVVQYEPGYWRFKPCVQVFTFGQHNNHWLGNNHRPLWCLYSEDAKFYPDAIRVPSWRQRNGDKRANAKGRVPGDVFDMQYPSPINERIGHWLSAALEDDEKHVCKELKADILEWFETCNGDVFDFPRVTGNSKQRCDWHPTQLHEELVERVVKFSTPEGGAVLDPFAGTGTTLRVCQRIGRDCTTIELDGTYCQRICADTQVPYVSL